MRKLLAFVLLLASMGAFAANPVADILANRTSGKVPLQVFFSATASTDADTTKPIHHLNYCFDAGLTAIPPDNVYNLVADSSVNYDKTTTKNQFCGAPGWAYVYETIGTHEARVTVCDEDGNCSTDTVSITVNDWTAAETRCVSTSGTFTGDTGGDGGADRCSGAAQTTSSDFDQAIADAIAAGDDQILFRGGESFSQSATVTISTGGVHIGAFGSGSYTITGTSSNPVFDMASGDDSRITDGIYVGNGTQEFIKYDSDNSADSDNVLVQNWTITNPQSITEMVGINLQSGTALPDGLGFFTIDADDCGNGKWCVFWSPKNSAVVDSYFRNGTTHVFRYVTSENVFFHGNRVADNGGAGDHLVTFRSWYFDCADDSGNHHCGVWSENVFVSDSWFDATSSDLWPLQLCSNPGSDNVQCRNYIIERNLHTVGDAAPLLLIRVGSGNPDSATLRNDFTFRNGLGNTTNAQNFSHIPFIQHTTTGTDSGMEYLGNSLYSGLSNATGSFVDTDTTSCIARNNIAWGINASWAFYNNSVCATSIDNWDTNGGTGIGDLSGCPFTVCPPTDELEFKLNGGSAVTDGLPDGGMADTNLCGFGEQTSRDASPDIGAYEVDDAGTGCVPEAVGGGGGPAFIPNQLLLAI